MEVQTNTETEEPIEIPNYDPEINLITGDLFGQIIDSNNDPIQDVKITIEAKTSNTNKYGTFSFENIMMNENGALVTAEKDGYVLGSRLFYPKEGELSRIKIKLIDRSVTKIVKADQGGTVDIVGGAQVIFENNSFVRLDDSEYHGNVSVITKYLDPTSINTADEMPGALVGIRPFEDNDEVALVSYGMVLVELESDGGQKLKLAPNTEAEIRLPIPQDLLSNAPEEIPLWYFNEDIGRWVEEESAIKQGSFYAGKVKHFTFWNCDFPERMVNLKIKVISGDRNPYAYQKVTLKIVDTNFQASEWTNKEGVAEGKIPVNRVIKVSILDLCGELLYDKILGTYTVDTQEDIIILPQNYISTKISGELKCDLESLEKAMLILDVGVEKLFYNVEATFDFDVFICPEFAGQVSCNFFDLEGLTESIEYPIRLESENKLDAVNVCDQSIDEYISVVYHGETVVFPQPTLTMVDFVDEGYTQITGQLDNQEINIIFQGLTSGDYSGETLINDMSVYKNTIYMPVLGTRTDGFFENFIVKEYGQEGGYIIGSFEGELINRAAPLFPVQISGLFRVKVLQTDFDGSYTEFITQKYRYVRPQFEGYLNTSQNVFFSQGGSNTGTTVVLAGNQANQYSLGQVTQDLHGLRLFLQINSASNIESEVINFGEIGEKVTGYVTGLYNEVYRSGVENEPFYFNYNIKRVPE